MLTSYLAVATTRSSPSAAAKQTKWTVKSSNQKTVNQVIGLKKQTIKMIYFFFLYNFLFKLILIQMYCVSIYRLCDYRNCIYIFTGMKQLALVETSCPPLSYRDFERIVSLFSHHYKT